MVHRYVEAHFVASYAAAIILTILQHGQRTCCSDPVETIIIAPISIPFVLIALPFIQTRATPEFAQAFTVYVAYIAIAAVYLLLLSRRVHPTPNHPVCPTCSYNLTGNTSGTCPECGHPIPQTSPKT